MRALAMTVCAAMVASSSATLAAPPDVAIPLSPMAEEWEAHRLLPWDPSPPLPFVVAAPLTTVGKPAIEVMGYLPYWEFGSVKLHLDQLTVLAYFGASLGKDGTVGDAHHWGSPEMAALVSKAHEAGVRVVIAITNFDKDSIHQFLASPAAVSKGITGLVDLAADQGADGVNIDFEGLALADKALFTDFIVKLKKALDKEIGDSHLSIATPAVDWSGAFDYDKLAGACNALFIMGYNYHWSGGQPGPVAPLAGGGKWAKHSLEWTIEDYVNNGGAANKGRFILGLPLYGIDWATADDSVPGKALAKGKSVFMASCLEEGAKHGWLWDEDSQTTYYMYKAESWHQSWCDTVKSHALKFDLVAAKGIGGVGFWALGYEEQSDDLWKALAEVFPPVQVEPDPEPESAVETGPEPDPGPEPEPEPDSPMEQGQLGPDPDDQEPPATEAAAEYSEPDASTPASRGNGCTARPGTSSIMDGVTVLLAVMQCVVLLRMKRFTLGHPRIPS